MKILENIHVSFAIFHAWFFLSPSYSVRSQVELPMFLQSPLKKQKYHFFSSDSPMFQIYRRWFSLVFPIFYPRRYMEKMVSYIIDWFLIWVYIPYFPYFPLFFMGRNYKFGFIYHISHCFHISHGFHGFSHVFPTFSHGKNGRNSFGVSRRSAPRAPSSCAAAPWCRCSGRAPKPSPAPWPAMPLRWTAMPRSRGFCGEISMVILWENGGFLSRKHGVK